MFQTWFLHRVIQMIEEKNQSHPHGPTPPKKKKKKKKPNMIYPIG